MDSARYPHEALVWLAGAGGRSVLVLGDHLLAEALTAIGHHAVVVPRGSDIVGEPRSVDAVIAVGALPKDLDTVARLLRPGGRLSLLLPERDHRIPWARKLDAAIGAPRPETPAAPLVGAGAFGFVDEVEFGCWEPVNRNDLLELLPTLPHLVDLDDADRDVRIAAALALYDDYGRGADGMQLPWRHRVFTATVVDQPWLPPRSETLLSDRQGSDSQSSDSAVRQPSAGDPSDETQPLDLTPTGQPTPTGRQAGAESGAGADQRRDPAAPGISVDPSDTGMILIDFR
ncbi:hypothetical protein [Nocardioides limicola]|uniref:hypothetical protein n=1 Tax=Nocardioides limicola TaxID=2803368 RepID=UPI00193B9A15|nr:hypothetical protein [Nocardioides sp. DJM-14]